MILHGDFETFSRANLKKCGGYRYAADPSTEILCFCWKTDDNEIETWVPSISQIEANRVDTLPDDWHYGRTVPPPLAVAIRAGATFTAHNASFERAVWQRVVVARHGGPSTRREQFICTATRASASGLPRALEPLALALGNAQQKDTEGTRLLNKFAKPRKPTKHDKRDRVRPLDEIEEFIRLVQYCQQDVRTEAEVDEIVPHLNRAEQELYAFDMKINERGFRIDIPLVHKTQKILAHLEAEVVAEVREITKSEQYPEGLKPTQRDKMMVFFHSIGVKLENMQADHVRKYMRENVRTLSAEGRRLLQLRIEAGKASTKKLASMLEYCLDDQIARGTLMMYGAHTGRWSGKGVQPHNFIRGLLKWIEQQRVFKLLATGDHEVFSILYEWPIGVISQVMRGFIIPAEGNTFYVVDYASIEARVLSWLADDQEMLVAFANGIDVYKLMATVIYNCTLEEVTSEQRRVSKNVVLGCFAADTEVLTERGWVGIEHVGIKDRVFDGVSYVQHDGVIYQGEKETIWLDGVKVTSDHLIWNESQWRTASSIAADLSFLRSVLNWETSLCSPTGSVIDRGLTDCRSTESILNEGIFHGTFDAALNGKISSISEPTFDILNCGPNSRFVIRTHSGTMLVHNCGYGLGPVKFVSYSEKAGVEISEELAKKAVKIYRKERYKIVALWGDIERAAIAAVRQGATERTPVKLRMLEFFVESRWLCVRLPSGRFLRYYQPRVTPVEKWGQPSLQLSYKVEFRGRMYSESTYGGKLVENITQAVARDLLVNGMLAAEAAGYTVRGTVHDEIITERPIGKGDIHELERIACTLPKWAKGMPVNAEGFESPRYRKG